MGLVVRRRIDFVARIEFYRRRAVAQLLDLVGAIKVNRQGVPISTIRTCLERLRQGRVVGIFPEGGVTRGKASVCNGGPIKLGACLLACRAQAPIIPVVVVGVHELMAVEPWLPFKRAHTWLAFGEPIAPLPAGRTIRERRAACREMGERLRLAMQTLHTALCAKYNLGDRTGATYAELSTASSPAHAPALVAMPRQIAIAEPSATSFGHASASPG